MWIVGRRRGGLGLKPGLDGVLDMSSVLQRNQLTIDARQCWNDAVCGQCQYHEQLEEPIVLLVEQDGNDNGTAAGYGGGDFQDFGRGLFEDSCGRCVEVEDAVVLEVALFDQVHGIECEELDEPSDGTVDL